MIDFTKETLDWLRDGTEPVTAAKSPKTGRVPEPVYWGTLADERRWSPNYAHVFMCLYGTNLSRGAGGKGVKKFMTQEKFFKILEMRPEWAQYDKECGNDGQA